MNAAQQIVKDKQERQDQVNKNIFNKAKPASGTHRIAYTEETIMLLQKSITNLQQKTASMEVLKLKVYEDFMKTCSEAAESIFDGCMSN